MTHVRGRLIHAVAIGLALLGATKTFFAAEPTYQLVKNPLKFPEGRGTGLILGIDVDRQGNIWVLDTCGGELGKCAKSNVDPLLKFDASGKFLKSYAGGLLAQPHGLYIDRSGNIWLVDGFGTPEKTPMKGHQVLKLSPDGKVL